MASVATEVFPGLWRLRLPFHLELNHVNVHLLRVEGGWLLADTGFNSEAAFAALEIGLREAAVDWPQIRSILLTHCHPDHMGLAPAVLERSQARLMVHGAEVAWVNRASNEEGQRALDSPMVGWGASVELVEKVRHAAESVRRSFHRLSPDVVLHGGEEIPTTTGAWTTVWTPGHSPGHVCLYNRQHRLLISGDHVLEKITPHIGWLPETDTLQSYLDSLARVAELEADTAFPSHGDPFGEVAARIREIERHHAWRCHLIGEHLDGNEKTVGDLVADLWQDALSPFQTRFAFYEVMAHLVYMEHRGEVRRRQVATFDYWSHG